MQPRIQQPSIAQLTAHPRPSVLTGAIQIEMSDDMNDHPVLTLDFIQDEASDEGMRLVATAKVLKITPQPQSIAVYRSEVATALAYEIMENPRAALGKDVIEVTKFLRIVPMNAAKTFTIHTTKSLMEILVDKRHIQVDCLDDTMIKLEIELTDRTEAGKHRSDDLFLEVVQGAFSRASMAEVQRVVTSAAEKIGIVLSKEMGEKFDRDSGSLEGKYFLNIESLRPHFRPPDLVDFRNVKITDTDWIHVRISRKMEDDYGLCRFCYTYPCYTAFKETTVRRCQRKSRTSSDEKKRNRDNFQARIAAKRARGAGPSRG